MAVRFQFPSGPAPDPRSRGMFGRPQQQAGGIGSGLKARLLIALAVALFAVIAYYGKSRDINSITGEPERVAMTDEAEEIQLGLQAAGEMVMQHGGPAQDREGRRMVQTVGFRLLNGLQKSLDAYNREHPNDPPRSNPYLEEFNFTLLADPETVNAFALPGGQVFITAALYDRLQTEGQLAGVLGHEIGHVIARHGNKQMARMGMFQGLAGAIGVLGGDMNSARMGQMVASAIGMKYGRDAELESDKWGVKLTALAGYDPRAMIGVMQILDEATGRGGGPPEFLSTHPKPANRVEYIEKVIKEEFPNGVPAGLKP